MGRGMPFGEAQSKATRALLKMDNIIPLWNHTIVESRVHLTLDWWIKFELF